MSSGKTFSLSDVPIVVVSDGSEEREQEKKTFTLADLPVVAGSTRKEPREESLSADASKKRLVTSSSGSGPRKKFSLFPLPGPSISGNFSIEIGRDLHQGGLGSSSSVVSREETVLVALPDSTTGGETCDGDSRVTMMDSGSTGVVQS